MMALPEIAEAIVPDRPDLVGGDGGGLRAATAAGTGFDVERPAWPTARLSPLPAWLVPYEKLGGAHCPVVPDPMGRKPTAAANSH